MATPFIGTSGWHYAHWRGPFYPDDLAATKWLGFYSEKISSVEINNSFYRLPQTSTIKAWVEQTPSDFIFALKAWRMLTHRKKLKNCEQALDSFFNSVVGFGPKLGPILFQLPPHWHCNVERLKNFIDMLPQGYRYAFEFRDHSWHNNAIYHLLREHNIAFCAFQLGGFTAPLEETADFVYVRLHGPDGPYAGNYSIQALHKWRRKILAWTKFNKDSYVFFDNDEAGYAAKNALLLDKLVKQSLAND